MTWISATRQRWKLTVTGVFLLLSLLARLVVEWAPESVLPRSATDAQLVLTLLCGGLMFFALAWICLSVTCRRCGRPMGYLLNTHRGGRTIVQCLSSGGCPRCGDSGDVAGPPPATPDVPSAPPSPRFPRGAPLV